MSDSAKSSGLSVVRIKKEMDGELAAVKKYSPPSQELYCVLHYPQSVKLGCGTCGIISSSGSLAAFREFDKRVLRGLREKKCKSKSLNKTVDKYVTATIWSTYEHVFIVQDLDARLAEEQLARLDEEYFKADLCPPLPIWVATNYYTSSSPWRSLTFCVAETKERAEELIGYILEQLAVEEERAPNKPITFDLYLVRPDVEDTIVHLTGVDGPAIPKRLFKFMDKCTFVAAQTPDPQETNDVRLAQSSTSNGAVAQQHIGAKRKHRAAPSGTEHSSKRVAVAAAHSNGVSDSTLVAKPVAEIGKSTANVANIDSEQSDELLAEMRELLDSGEAQLIPSVSAPRPSKAGSKSKLNPSVPSV